MSDDRNTKKCEELIDEQLEGRMTTLRNHLKHQTGDWEDEDLCTCGHPWSDHDGNGKYHYCMAETDEKDQDGDPVTCSCSEFESADEYDEDEDPLDPIGMDREIVTKLTLSWGGPADYFEVHQELTDENRPGEITEIWYLYQDWFDGARRKVTGEDFHILAGHFSYLEEM